MRKSLVRLKWAVIHNLDISMYFKLAVTMGPRHTMVLNMPHMIVICIKLLNKFKVTVKMPTIEGHFIFFLFLFFPSFKYNQR